MNNPEISLFVREGDRIVPAPPEDIEVARGYPAFSDKGAVHRGYRLTILTRSTRYRAGEEVRVIHVCEAVEPGSVLYVMGPKRVYGELVDGRMATDPPPNPEEPLVPAQPYDGRVVPGPGVDVNYEITRYRFDNPGEHTISWQLGDLVSNVRRIEVSP